MWSSRLSRIRMYARTRTRKAASRIDRSKEALVETTFQLDEDSKENLLECAPELIMVFGKLSYIFPTMVLCGRRDKRSQNHLHTIGASKVRWPNSKHNTSPSLAIDAAPYPYRAKTEADVRRFCYMAGYAMRIAQECDVAIRWGGDWDRDLELNDQTFNDLAHFELVVAKDFAGT